MVKQKTLKHLLGTGILQLRNVHIQLCSVPKPVANMVSPNRSSKHYRWLACGCSSLSASLQPHSSESIAISWHLSVLCVLLETTPTFVKASPSCHHPRRSHTLCFSCPFWSSISKSAEGMGKKDTEPFHGVYIPPQIFQMKNVYCLEENLPLGW